MGFSSKKTTTKQTVTPTNPAWVEPQLSTLAGRITDLSKMDPYGFVAGPNALQTRAYEAAANLAPDPWSYAGARGALQDVMGAGASAYDPATIKPTSLLPNLSSYMSPYLKDVVDTSLADYDFGAGQTRAQNKLALAGDETFGGSGGAIQTALSEDALARGRGALAARLRDDAFQTGANLANLEADRRQQAKLANMAALNRAWEFNAGQNEAALARRQGAARDLADSVVTGVNTQAAIGDAMRQIEQQRTAAPLSTISTLAGAYNALPLSLLHGEITKSTTKQAGSVLDAIQQMVDAAASGRALYDAWKKKP